MIDLDGYRLVWSDEFDGDAIDKSRWEYRAHQSFGEDLAFRDERIYAKDGCAILSMTYDKTQEEKPYQAPYSLTTDGTMNFRYGYVEVRAKMPYYGKGEWPAIWLIPRSSLIKNEENQQIAPDYSVEIDIFESFSSLGDVIPQLHLWSKNIDDHPHRANLLSDPNRKFVFPDPATANDFHLYGCLWTEKQLRFYMDDVCYYSYDIPAEDQKALSTYQPILLSLQFFSEKYVEKTHFGKVGTLFHENPDAELTMAVDYVRLYQNPETDEIVTK